MNKSLPLVLILLGTLVSFQGKSVGLLDSNATSYEFNAVLQYGGEAKLTAFFPKINILRKHSWNIIKPYYGIEAGLHPLLVTAAYNGSMIVGIEKGLFNVESSLSYTRNLGIRPPQGGDNIPHAQGLFNLKAGFGYKGIRLKLGRSLVLWENNNQRQSPLPFFNLGKINGRVYGIELQFRINKKTRN